ncbi:hypothetical protein, partial [Coprobacter sp.]
PTFFFCLVFFPFRIFRIFFPRFFPFSYFIPFPEVYLIRRDAYSDLYYILLSCGYFSGDMLLEIQMPKRTLSLSNHPEQSVLLVLLIAQWIKMKECKIEER